MCQEGSTVSELLSVSMFMVEKKKWLFLQNVGTHVLDYTVSCPWGHKYEPKYSVENKLFVSLSLFYFAICFPQCSFAVNSTKLMAW